MPLVIHPRVRKSVGRLAALTCVAVFASTGAALAACPSQPVSTPFTHWGDNSSYFLVPGGSFEGTTAQVGWTLSNASLTSTNDSSSVSHGGGEQALTINGGGSATSPYFCLDSTMTAFRFFARQLQGGSDLKVVGLVKTWYGAYRVPLAAIPDGSMSSWGPVSKIAIPTSRIPIQISIPVSVRFVVPSEGSWQMKDVYVDPYRNS
jgi:hypothetical protein